MRLRLTHPGRPSPRTVVVAGMAGLGMALVAALPGAAAAGSLALAPSTTAGPAGHAFTASLAGGTASFTVGSVSVICDTSTTSGGIPAEPDNANPDGPVVGPITAPEFANAGADSCPTNLIFTSATSTTSGDWTISLQFDPVAPTGALTIPQAGLVAQISGLASCTITAAPDGPAAIVGAWVPGPPPLLDFSAGVEVPIAVTGGLGCPTAATTAIFSAVYQVDNTTDPTQPITVTA